MELMENETLPVLCQCSSGIGSLVQPFGYNGGAFRCIPQKLILTVVQLHGSLGSITSGTVNIHQQFTVELGQFRMACVRLEVFIYPVTRGTDNLQRTIALQAFLYGTYRLQCR